MQTLREIINHIDAEGYFNSFEVARLCRQAGITKTEVLEGLHQVKILEDKHRDNSRYHTDRMYLSLIAEALTPTETKPITSAIPKPKDEIKKRWQTLIDRGIIDKNKQIVPTSSNSRKGKIYGGFYALLLVWIETGQIVDVYTNIEPQRVERYGQIWGVENKRLREYIKAIKYQRSPLSVHGAREFFNSL